MDVALRAMAVYVLVHVRIRYVNGQKTIERTDLSAPSVDPRNLERMKMRTYRMVTPGPNSFLNVEKRGEVRVDQMVSTSNRTIGNGLKMCGTK